MKKIAEQVKSWYDVGICAGNIQVVMWLILGMTQDMIDFFSKLAWIILATVTIPVYPIYKLMSRKKKSPKKTLRDCE